MIESLLKLLEHAGSRSVRMALAIIGLVLWWVVKSVRKFVRSTDKPSPPAPSEPERPRRRLPLR